jgi:hypothetical protein
MSHGSTGSDNPENQSTPEGKICPQDGSVCWDSCNVAYCEGYSEGHAAGREAVTDAMARSIVEAVLRHVTGSRATDRWRCDDELALAAVVKLLQASHGSMATGTPEEAGCEGCRRFMRALGGSTVRLYPDTNYEKYLDEMVASAVEAVGDTAEDGNEHLSALLRQFTEAVGNLRKSRDELRRDLNRVALAAVQDE